MERAHVMLRDDPCRLVRSRRTPHEVAGVVANRVVRPVLTNSRERVSNRPHALLNALMSSVDHNAIAIPRTVIPLDHLVPRRGPQSCDIGDADRAHPSRG